MPNTLREAMHRELVRGLVQSAITCPRTGQVLDVRTCVVLVDPDGDPRAVLSQRGWRQVLDDHDTLAGLAKLGLTVDESTVKASK